MHFNVWHYRRLLTGLCALVAVASTAVALLLAFLGSAMARTVIAALVILMLGTFALMLLLGAYFTLKSIMLLRRVRQPIERMNVIIEDCLPILQGSGSMTFPCLNGARIVLALRLDDWYNVIVTDSDGYERRLVFKGDRVIEGFWDGRDVVMSTDHLGYFTLIVDVMYAQLGLDTRVDLLDVGSVSRLTWRIVKFD